MLSYVKIAGSQTRSGFVLEKGKPARGGVFGAAREYRGGQSARRQQDRDKLKQLAPPPQMDLFGR